MDESKMSVLDLMRLRYMKGEPLLQAGDSFDFAEGLAAMETVNNEARARGLGSPIAIQQPECSVIENPGRLEARPTGPGY